MLLDDGGDLTALMHKEYKNLLKEVKGIFARNLKVKLFKTLLFNTFQLFIQLLSFLTVNITLASG